MNATISSSSLSFLASCLGLESAQRALNHYKKSKYTACCKEIAYTIGTLSCVVSLGVLAYIYLSNESEKTPSQQSSTPLKDREINDLEDTLFLDPYDIFISIINMGYGAPVLNKPSKVSFSNEVKVRHFFVERLPTERWSSRAKKIVQGIRWCPIEKVSRRYIGNNPTISLRRNQ